MTVKSVRARTADRGPPEAPEIYTVTQLGPKRAYTPNGNLICYEVPIARTGMLMYKAGEIPMLPDRFGVIRVHRHATELFRPETIGSFMGVAVTDEHPPELEVTPSTWKKYAHGFSTTNVYQGEGDDADVLFADLVITDKALIQKILDGKVEVSAGYDSDYEQTGDGEAIQTNIVGNHIALVERGRCGPRCAIGDHDPFNQPEEGNDDMTIRKRLLSTEERGKLLLRALTGDADGLTEEGSDPPSDAGAGGNGATHIHIHAGSGGSAGQPSMPNTLSTDEGPDMLGNDNPAQPVQPNQPMGDAGDLGARIAALEASVQKILSMLGGQQPGTGDEDPDMEEGGEGGEGGEDEGNPFAEKTGDELPVDERIEAHKTGTGDELPVDDRITAHKTGDSAAFARNYQQLVADVEILVPGMRVPTFDSKATRAKTVDRMCSIRRRALHQYASTTDGAAILGNAADPGKLEDMPCDALATTFKTAVAAQKVLNNRAATGDAAKLPEPAQPMRQGAVSIDAINKANAEFYARHMAKLPA